ncbi:hypothetical protein T484DRAFT_1796527 [Baffinella frigidus]|nr:hypothetical protein T484DRAFT_1796527 [Cryptophyta sp. CCMP2293]
MVVDLTFTTKYYQPSEFTSRGVQHLRIPERGHSYYQPSEFTSRGVRHLRIPDRGHSAQL